jgi:hypothetical protein
MIRSIRNQQKILFQSFNCSPQTAAQAAAKYAGASVHTLGLRLPLSCAKDVVDQVETYFDNCAACSLPRLAIFDHITRSVIICKVFLMLNLIICDVAETQSRYRHQWGVQKE